MQAGVVARNYADTLLALAQREGNGGVEAFGRAIDEVVQILRTEPLVRAFLESPGIDQEAKKDALCASFQERVPERFLRFLLVVAEKRRERVLPDIAEAYHALVDEMLGRVRAEVILAYEPDPAFQRRITNFLERRLGKTVLARFRVNPEMLGGIVIRVEDEVFDASLRRRLEELRRRLLNTPVPQLAAQP